MSGYYILIDKHPVKTGSMLEWSIAYNNDRIVEKTTIGESEVSTVFLGMDHGFNGTPMLFETMVFGGKMDMYFDRYSTWEEAEKGHHRICAEVIESN